MDNYFELTPPIHGYYVYSKYDKTKNKEDGIIGKCRQYSGSEGEFIIEWVEIDGERFPKVSAFDDTLDMIVEIKESIDKMLDEGKPTSVDDIRTMLENLYILELTYRTTPDV